MTEADKAASERLSQLAVAYSSPHCNTIGHVRGAIVSALAAFLGVREIGTTNTGYWIDKFHAVVGLRPGYPWCLMFIQYVYAEISRWFSIPDVLPNNTAGTQALAAWAEGKGYCRTDVRDIAAGDLIVWRDGKSANGHVGAVIESTSSSGVVFTVRTIEGNTSSQDYRDGGTIAEKQYSVTQGELGAVRRKGRWIRCVISFDALYAEATK